MEDIKCATKRVCRS